MEYRWADGEYDRLPTLAADLVRKPVTLMLMAGLNRAGYLAGKAATSTIPVVFVIGEDPVGIGLVASFNRPGGNVTGIALLFEELWPKRIGLLHDLLPRAKALAVLMNPATGGDEELSNVREAAKSLGLQIKLLNAKTDRDIDLAFASLADLHVDALLVLTDPFFFARANKIASLAERIAVPAMYIRREFAAAGGLISYGSNTDETYRLLGDYAGRILRGTSPGDLPVQQAVKLELVINLKAAKALGLTVPDTLLALADDVIE
jgi:putative ABC transport system substrate-binding protein